MTKDKRVFDYSAGIPLAPVHPGETLAEEMSARKLCANALALKLRIAANRLNEIVAGKRGVSAETALRLGRYFGTGAQFWVNLQARYELAAAEGTRSKNRVRGRRGVVAESCA